MAGRVRTEDQPNNDLEPIAEPSVSGTFSNFSILHGPLTEPIVQLQSYDPAKWERFIAEWAVGCLKEKYSTVWKSKGSGDRGRDVAGFFSEPISQSDWDNYQCKHYTEPLTPSDVWSELGKLIYYCFTKVYRPPKSYKFVAPKGIGGKLLGLIEKPDELRSGLIAAWPKHCEKSIVKGQSFVLEGDLRKYLDAFDFTIISFLEPQHLIESHSDTKWHATRFGGGLRKQRPKPPSPPAELAEIEHTYAKELKEAYKDQEKKEMTLGDVIGHSIYGEHFKRQRENFYEAESLKRFAEETLADAARYEDLEQQIFDGVIDVVESNHVNAFDKVKDALKTAKTVQISDHPLSGQLRPSDRGGICHQLVNKLRFKWKRT